MDVEKTVIYCISDITGLDEDSFETIRDDNLFTAGILNSLSLATLIRMIERKLEIKIDIKRCKITDFYSINSIVRTVQACEK